MLATQIEVSDGTLSIINVGIQFFKQADISVSLDQSDLPLVLGVDYVWSAATTITFLDSVSVPGGLVPIGVEVFLRRDTKNDFMYNILDGGAPFSRLTLDENYKQLLFLTQEFSEGLGLDGLRNNLNMNGYKVTNVGNPTNAGDATNKAYVDAGDAHLLEQLVSLNARTLRTPEDVPALPSAGLRANKVLGFNSVGDPVATLPGTGTATELALDLLNESDVTKGTGLVGYTYGTAHSEGRDTGGRLRETRSILDFIPRTQRAAIKDGTSRWSATVAMNYALQETSGGILIPAGCIVPIDGPIDIGRSNELVGGGPFDTTPGKGSKIYILDGSNCEAIRTPYAVNPVPGSQTHFMGLRDIVIDGNKAGQTTEVAGGLVKFWGAFVGSWIKRVLVLNSYGTAVDFRGGSDVEVDHLWIAACTTATGYALDTNADLSGSLLGGLMSFSNLYVENTGIDKAHDAKTEEAYRGKNIRLRRLVRGQISEVHSEGGAVAIDLDTNHTIRIGSITGYNIGSTNEPESALVRHIGGLSRAVSIGTMFFAGTSNSPKLVRVSSGIVGNNATPEVPFTTNPYVRGYASSSDSAFNFDRSAKTAFTGNVAVERIGTNAEIAMQLAWGDPDSASTGKSKLKERGLGPALTSSLNQPSNADKDFIFARSAGGTGDSITMSDPVKVGTRASATNVTPGMLYYASAFPGVGETLVVQGAQAGVNASAKPVVTMVRGGGPPSNQATSIGMIYHDTTNNKIYFSIAFAGVLADWLILN